MERKNHRNVTCLETSRAAEETKQSTGTEPAGIQLAFYIPVDVKVNREKSGTSKQLRDMHVRRYPRGHHERLNRSVSAYALGLAKAAT